MKATCLNILFSLTGVIVNAFTRKYGPYHTYEDRYLPLPLLYFSLAILLVGLLLTLVLLFTICSYCCCPNSCPSSSASTSSSCLPPPQFGVYLPSFPHKVFIRDQTQPNGRKEIKEDTAEEMNEEEEAKEEEKGEVAEKEPTMERNDAEEV